jgi:RNA polymerase sigma-70 factor, ECF subfamily
LGSNPRERRGLESGPDESFRRLFEEHYRKVFLFFVRRGFPDDECEDLAQEVFLRVHKHLGSFRGEARVETWLFQIAANLYRNTLRGKAALKRQALEVVLNEEAVPAAPEPAGPLHEAAEPGPFEQVLAKERSRILHGAIEELPCQMRRCLLLRVDQDLKYREIAELLRISIETVKAHLFQARQLLRIRLGAEFAEDGAWW